MTSDFWGWGLSVWLPPIKGASPARGSGEGGVGRAAESCGVAILRSRAGPRGSSRRRDPAKSHQSHQGSDGEGGRAGGSRDLSPEDSAPPCASEPCRANAITGSDANSADLRQEASGSDAGPRRSQPRRRGVGKRESGGKEQKGGSALFRMLSCLVPQVHENDSERLSSPPPLSHLPNRRGSSQCRGWTAQAGRGGHTGALASQPSASAKLRSRPVLPASSAFPSRGERCPARTRARTLGPENFGPGLLQACGGTWGVDSAGRCTNARANPWRSIFSPTLSRSRATGSGAPSRSGRFRFQSRNHLWFETNRNSTRGFYSVTYRCALQQFLSGSCFGRGDPRLGTSSAQGRIGNCGGSPPRRFLAE